MEPLNQKNANRLIEILGHGRQACPPYLVDGGDRVVVTNNSFLLEWPEDRVDRKCNNYAILKRNSGHSLANAKRISAGWRKSILGDDGMFDGVFEVGPKKKEQGFGCVVFADTRSKRALYHWTNIELAELFVPDVCYFYFRGGSNKTDSRLRMMAIFSGTVGPVGMFANYLPPV